MAKEEKKTFGRLVMARGLTRGTAIGLAPDSALICLQTPEGRIGMSCFGAIDAQWDPCPWYGTGQIALSQTSWWLGGITRPLT